MFKPMKAETIERRSIARKARIAASKASLIERLTVKAKEAGRSSIWAEMLASHESQTP